MADRYEFPKEVPQVGQAIRITGEGDVQLLNECQVIARAKMQWLPGGGLICLYLSMKEAQAPAFVSFYEKEGKWFWMGKHLALVEVLSPLEPPSPWRRVTPFPRD
ncbi:MAG: hypothetical protein V1902_03255 [Candidatus Falkowbacteria bacterium]